MMGLHRGFLIDGTACCYRAFYAIRHLSTKDGRPTNAVYGVAMMLEALRERHHPDYLAVAFDVGKPTFRHQQFAQYKIQRKPMPESLIGQLPTIKSLLSAYRIPTFELEGYEGEDVLATIAKRLASNQVEIWLVTSDKDALQLVNDHVKVYNPYKDPMIMDAEAVHMQYGILPEQMVDLLTLMGDESDNIPGVAGIGEKTATQLLQRFGTVAELYRHLEDIESPSIRRRLEAGREQMKLSQELIRIHSDLPISVSLEDLKMQEPNWRALREIFRELEFKKLLKESEVLVPQISSSALKFHWVSTSQELEGWLKRLLQVTTPVSLGAWVLKVASEQSRGSDGQGRVLLGVAPSDEEACLIPLDGSLLQTEAGRRLSQWLADSTPQKIGHDVKNLIHHLESLGVGLKGIVGDTLIAAYLLNPARTNQSLSDLADEHLGWPLGVLPSSLEGSLTTGSSSLLMPFTQALCTVHRLHEQLVSGLKANGLFKLYTTLEIPLIHVLVQMESTGIAVDLGYLQGLKASMDGKLIELTKKIYGLSGGSFNLNSPRQLSQVLFERLQLPVLKRTKTGPSTDSDVLHQLAGRHPLPECVLQYRELSKLVSTYLEALPILTNPATGRIHTTLNQTATATGRLSSSEPNLQNIPIKTELGRLIRKAFIPGIPDGLIVAMDYSQIELRILAHLSKDEQLLEAFRAGRDIHRVTASLIYGIPEAEVKQEQRSNIKAVNFGILYGMTQHGLSKELGKSFEEAQAIIDAYFKRYPKIRGYLDRQIAQAKQDGFVQTLLGRRRYVPELKSPDPALRQLGERIAINTPIQGTAADLIKQAMVQVADQLARQHLSSRMILQVHDELVFECPRNELQQLSTLARSIMETALVLDVPLTVTIKAGPNWLELEVIA